MSDVQKVLAGKVALVTGSAGTMGLAATRVLLEDGCKVAMVDFSRERNEALARDLGPNAFPFSFDISDAEAVRTGHASIVKAMGPVDILLNNAGILSNNKVEATDAQEWRRVPTMLDRRASSAWMTRTLTAFAARSSSCMRRSSRLAST